jgi:hypothetical protein
MQTGFIWLRIGNDWYETEMTLRVVQNAVEIIYCLSNQWNTIVDAMHLLF